MSLTPTQLFLQEVNRASAQSGELLELRGLVKTDSVSPDALLISLTAKCEDWVAVPLSMIAEDPAPKVLAIKRCKDHSHPYSQLWLKKPQQEEGKIIFSLLSGIIAVTLSHLDNEEQLHQVRESQKTQRAYSQFVQPRRMTLAANCGNCEREYTHGSHENLACLDASDIYYINLRNGLSHSQSIENCHDYCRNQFPFSNSGFRACLYGCDHC